jgi:phosphatidylserine decarboxylase
LAAPRLFVPIVREGWPFVAASALATLVLGWWWPPLFWVGVPLTGWCAYFFRDPPRVTPTRTGLVVAPADGIVSAIADAPPPAELDMGSEPRTRISVFLNVFDVHINRIPADGVVAKTVYHAGRFLNAALDKASEDNERNAIAIDLSDGRTLAVVQIAGLIARRIVCWVGTGDRVLAGARMGMIRFGSRTDLYLPEGVAPLVAVGQRSVGGETVFADLNASEAARQGAVR